MDRSDAKKALDDAFTDGMRKIFDVLVMGLSGGDKSAQEKFGRGLETLKHAHELGTAEVEKTFGA